MYAVHNRFVPVQKYFTLSLKADSIPEALKSKTYLAYTPENEKEFSYAGGRWKGDVMVAKTRDLGKYTLLADITAPVIKPLNFANKAKITGKRYLAVKIEDKESGIKNYTATLNGHWILMEYDAKSGRLTYYPDRYLKKGKNVFLLKVSDNTGNTGQYKAVLYN